MSEVCMDGRCLCGDVRYRVSAKPYFVHCCHCRDCQRLSGSAFAINAMVEAKNVELLQGKTETIKVPSPSGMGQLVVRCPNCKTAVWSHYGPADKKEKICFLRAGTLDEPEQIEPDIHIYTRSKLPWVKLPDDKPAVEEFYKYEDLWPTESLARRNAALMEE